MHLDWLRSGVNKVNGPKVFDYDEIWKTVIETLQW